METSAAQMNYYAKDSGGKEIAGKDRFPMRTEKTLPGKSRLYEAVLPEVTQNFVNGFMRNLNGKLFKLSPDTPCAPEKIFFFQF